MFLGLDLLEVLTSIQGVGDDRLHIQIDVFNEEAHGDSELLSGPGALVDLDSHTEVFYSLHNNVANTPQSSSLLNILRGFLLLDPKDPHRFVIPSPFLVNGIEANFLNTLS